MRKPLFQRDTLCIITGACVSRAKGVVCYSDVVSEVMKTDAYFLKRNTFQDRAFTFASSLPFSNFAFGLITGTMASGVS